jgi:GrpB-like predicted nucleotidyltransferase (UPF0157 family)
MTNINTVVHKTFHNIIIEVKHIGSTSIPGLTAKPIIDINIGVKSLEIAKKEGINFNQILLH